MRLPVCLPSLGCGRRVERGQVRRPESEVGGEVLARALEEVKLRDCEEREVAVEAHGFDPLERSMNKGCEDKGEERKSVDGGAKRSD